MSSSEVPSAPEPAVQRGARLLAEGQAAEAARVLGRIVDEAPVYAAAHVLLAAALDADGRPAEALDVWHRAAFLVPSSPLVRRERRRLLGGEAAAPVSVAAAPELDAVSDLEPVGEEVSSEPVAEPASTPVPSDPAPAAEPPSPFAPPATPETRAPQEPVAELTPVVEPESLDEPAPRAGADESDSEVSSPVTDASAPSSVVDLPEGGHVAPADELFTHVPAPPAEAPTEPTPHPADRAATLHGGASGVAAEAPPPPPQPAAAASPPVPPAAPDWGDLDDFAVSVLPPTTPPAPPPPPVDPGGWALLGEDERPVPRTATVRPPVAPPDAWIPPAAERPATPLGAASPSRPDPPEPALADDLDALIESLETAPRITPDPGFSAPAPDLDSNVDDLASETLAKIYAAQHQYVEAAVVYERLAARTPEQANVLLERAAEMRRHADDA